jgi:hypothetical protein
MVIAFVLFFLLGLGFGYSLQGLAPWSALLIPLLMALGTMLFLGSDSTVLVRLVISLVVTAVGVVLGMVIAQRGETREAGTG